MKDLELELSHLKMLHLLYHTYSNELMEKYRSCTTFKLKESIKTTYSKFSKGVYYEIFDFVVVDSEIYVLHKSENWTYSVLLNDVDLFIK
jgi:uncharacterized phage-associated protein